VICISITYYVQIKYSEEWILGTINKRMLKHPILFKSGHMNVSRFVIIYVENCLMNEYWITGSQKLKYI
jgi:hypothetical protein